MVVQHNMPALTANRYYTTNNSSLSKSLEKLSSGYSINRAGDNAAGLAVSEKMRAQIAGLTQASKNAEDGISMVQTYEGALQETDSILQRMRTIAVQSANGTYQNDVDRDALQLEFDQLNDELNQIADTDFNGVVALNGGVMADGTVVNDSTKVAERPNVENIETSPDATFTYKSVVNGTVDGGGNGSVSVNGVSIKLTGGSGSTSLGSAATGITSYSAENLQVTNGKVSGSISATETYKIDSSTSGITIHGQTFNINGSKLVDADGNDVTTIDGLAVEVNHNENVTLSGTYGIKNNEVIESQTFKAVQDGTEVGGSIDASGNGKIVINSNTITLNGGEGGPSPATGITYTATGFAVDTDKNEVSGEVTTGGSVDVNTSISEKVNVAASDHAENTDTGAATGSLKISINGKAAYAKKDGSGNYTYFSAANCDSASSITDFTDYFNSASTKINVETDSTTGMIKSYTEQTFSVSVNGKDYALTSGTDATSGLYDFKKANVASDSQVSATNKNLKDGIIELATADLDVSSVDGTDANKKSVDVVAKTITVDKEKLSEKEVVGNFKISKGVSASDSFNHGTANLTFADNMTLQVGARSKDAVTFNFSYTTNGIGNLKADLNASARGLGTDQVSVKNQEDANAAIDAIDNAINKVSMIRGTFGAIQNRLEHKISNINTNAENLTAAESRIRDTQMDQEMMKFTSAQILSQASQSMLAQANSLPQGVLQLLG